MRINNMVGSLVLAGALLCIPAGSKAVPAVGVVVSVRVSPPVLPVYAQPLCPGAGYIWEPGYWAWFFGGSDEGRNFIYNGYSTTRMLYSEASYQSEPQ